MQMRHCSARVLSVWLAITTFLLANPAAAAKLDSQQRAAAFPGYKESASDMQAAAGRWAGAATAAGTARFAAQHPAATGHCRQHPVSYSGVDAGPSTLTLSSLGIGTYLGAADAATDQAVSAAVIKSVEAGWNVIDTAANYRGGRAEVSIGEALRALRAGGAVEREQLFVSTKAGFPRAGLLERVLQGGGITAADVAGGSHCMHPAYLQASLDGSLEALGLEAVDLLYLHNPAESQLPAVGHREFMQRLKSAFEWCEGARAAGRIRSYGIASWSCFRVPPEDAAHLSLQAVADVAAAVGGADHGFRYIQLPIGAGMPEAWQQPWQELRGAGGGDARRATALEAAQELGLGVFSSGPLLQGKLLRDPSLARAAGAAPQLQAIQGEAPRLLQLARSTPGILTALVGHKTAPHVDQNCALAQISPLNATQFRAAMEAVLAP